MDLIKLILPKLLLVFSFLVYLFWTWRLGKRAGFHKEKMLDLVLAAPAAGLLLQWVLGRLGLNSALVFWLGFGLGVFYFAHRENWSLNKLGDVFAQGLSLSLIFYPYFPHPVFNFLVLFIFLLIGYVSRLKLRSGFTFLAGLFCGGVFFGLISLFRSHDLKSVNSLLSLAAVAGSVLSLRRKEYKEAMDLLKYSLPQDILNELNQKLLAKKKSLVDQEKTLSDEETALKKEEITGGDDEDVALIEEETSKNENLLGFIRRAKDEIERALNKLKGGDYGLCEKCRRPIDKARLVAEPEARFCVNCEKKEESSEVGVSQTY